MAFNWRNRPAISWLRREDPTKANVNMGDIMQREYISNPDVLNQLGYVFHLSHRFSAVAAGATVRIHIQAGSGYQKRIISKSLDVSSEKWQGNKYENVSISGGSSVDSVYCYNRGQDTTLQGTVTLNPTIDVVGDLLSRFDIYGRAAAVVNTRGVQAAGSGDDFILAEGGDVMYEMTNTGASAADLTFNLIMAEIPLAVL